MKPSSLADPEEIRRSVMLLREPDTLIEMRCPRTKRSVVSGYFDDPELLVRNAVEWSGQSEAVYVTLNPVLPDLLARAANRVELYARHTTSDGEIVRRRWLLVDLDPQRPAGISSTDEEHQAALLRARECRDWLKQERWPDPVFADSGNGAHLLYRIDAPNNAAAKNLLSASLAALASRFSDNRVSVDPTTFNASRISKLYGTLAAKGDSVPALGRIHRLARMLDVFRPSGGGRPLRRQ